MRIHLELPSGAVDLEANPAPGASLSQALRQKGQPLNTRCGERGLCHACLVEVEEDGEWREVQSCQIQPWEGMKVRAPQSSLLASKPQVQSDFRLGIPLALDPLFGPSGLGVAVDVGTTTVALRVLDLATGAEVGRAASFNRQMALGDDVLTRISLCLASEEAVGQMQSALAATLEELALEALAGEPVESIAGWTLSGNTTMLHLALGINPAPLGTAPFTPVFLEPKESSAQDMGLPGLAPVVTLPGAGAYVGADIVAGLLASGFVYHPEAILFVDAGTNGEMVVKQGGRLIGCATAAGPAFEGSGLKCGVRAVRGAVSHLALGEEGFSVEVIGGEEAGRPIGLCGSSYVDFLATARQGGLLTAGGRLTDQLPGLIQSGDYGKEARVAVGQGKRPLVVSEPDVASLLQAKAAIAAGILTLMRKVGLAPGGGGRLVLAGGFGMHLNLENARNCGLLPGFQPGQVELVGNTSLGGASAALLDRGLMKEMERLAQEVEVIELNQDPDFEDTFIDCLSLDADF